MLMLSHHLQTARRTMLRRKRMARGQALQLIWTFRARVKTQSPSFRLRKSKQARRRQDQLQRSEHHQKFHVREHRLET
jgi:hypothetical protein